MTQGETRIAAVLAAVASCKYTVAQLKQTLADGLAHVEAHGVKNVERELIEELAASGMSISIKEVQLRSRVFLALVQTTLKDDPQIVKQLKDQGGIILAIDGVQPEKGNETLWLLRDARSERVLVARNLLSSGCLEIEPLIAEVKALGVPILGVISDKQESMCLAVEKQLPGAPHQLCHFHYLRDVAKPVCEADRKLKKELKQKVRGIRQVERQVASKRDDEARVVSGYGVAIREAISVTQAAGSYVGQ